jgi:IS30 family transposase
VCGESRQHGSEGASAQQCAGATRLLIGLERSAIGTVVERTTRFTTLVHLPREEGYRHKHTVKNGPALAGYGALTMKNALANTMSTLPEQMLRSLTWDRGKEMSAHAQFKIETGIPVFFADPQSPWQRGTNENTVSIGSGSVGPLRQAGAGSSR